MIKQTPLAASVAAFNILEKEIEKRPEHQALLAFVRSRRVA